MTAVFKLTTARSALVAADHAARVGLDAAREVAADYGMGHELIGLVGAMQRQLGATRTNIGWALL